MAGPTPSQNRAIDPFSSYNSDVANQLSRSTSRNSNGFLAVSDFLVEIDSTSPLDTVVVKPGFALVSDVLIQTTANHTVDFRNSQHYVTPSGGIFDETGYYYVVLEYIYAKSRPAPTAKIKILRPSETNHASLGTSLIFIQAVQVVAGVGSNEISAIYEYDPSDTTVRRRFVDLNISADRSVPTHDPDRDRGRILYETLRNKYWFGFEDRWEEISAGVSININTSDSTALQVGMLAYNDSNGNAQPAIATGGLDTRAEMIVLEIGTVATGNGRARLAGAIEDVLVETGIIIANGDVLYLSESEYGKVTNVRPGGTYQVIGRALSDGSQVIPVTVLFFPGDIITTAVSGSIDPGDWIASGGNYYFDVDITRLNLQVNSLLINCWSSAFKISPTDVEIRDAGDTCRITMSTNALTVDYTISDGAGGGSAGGGGGGSTSHALLTNLDYASSGHTGFAQNPHGNAAHTSTFITATGVTYGNLNANGDVGTGSTQVSRGNHTHTEYIDVPSGEIILFERNDAVTGYTLLTGFDDGLVYVTKGSVAGGQTGGTTYSGGTWTQPNHSHSFSDTHTHTTGNHTLTIAEMPSHTHDVTTLADGTGDLGWEAAGFGSHTVVSQPTGGGGAHNHGNTGVGSVSGTTGGSATTGTWRPKGRNFTRQQRN